VNWGSDIANQVGTILQYAGIDVDTADWDLSSMNGDVDAADVLTTILFAAAVYQYAGANDLSGGSGDDLLYSGMYNDDLRGGEGNDTYFFSMGDGKDSIYEHLEDGDGYFNNTTVVITENDIFDDITLNSESVVVGIESDLLDSEDNLVLNFVKNDVSYGKLTIEDYQQYLNTNFNVELYSDNTEGGWYEQVATYSITDLANMAGTQTDFTMTSAWTLSHLNNLSDKLIEMLGGTTTSESSGSSGTLLSFEADSTTLTTTT
jgi:hypothetical protein